jgi:hypothetical protein
MGSVEVCSEAAALPSVRGHMARSWWVVFGALGAACLIGGVAFLARVSDPEPGNHYALYVGPALGLVVGGVLGSRIPVMARPARISFGALVVGGLLAFVAGWAFLFLGGSGGGLARFQGKNFGIGAIVGGVAGVFVGGMLGAKTAGQKDGGLGGIE